MDKLPRAPQRDSTLAFLRKGYAFVGLTCDSLGSDLFETRLMLRRVTCMRGLDALTAFYSPGRFTRRGAIPATVVSLLQDYGSVMTLDGEAHRKRKRMFLSLMRGSSLEASQLLLAEEWWHALGEPGPVRLQDLAHLICSRVALRWCGLDAELPEAARHTAAFRAMIEGAGSTGLAQLRGQVARRRMEHWATHIIEARRAAEPEDTPVDVVAFAQDDEGRLLPTKIAAIELINLLRPTVAVGRYITFAAHGLYLHPEWHERILASRRSARAFAQEVRRFYPFIPVMGGRVLVPFAFHGIRFSKGDWVLFDIYGTNHHRSWVDPERFQPDRFLEDRLAETRIVAQGGGDRLKGHRCAGEDMTVAMLEEACRLLAETDYEVPEQDLAIPLNRFPTGPKSGMRIVLR